MLPNFLQKPAGVVAVLATAVGGPYAAFETELGTSIRRTLVSATETAAKSVNAQNEVLPNSNDPYSLLAANNTNNSSYGSAFSNSSPAGNVGSVGSWNGQNATASGQLVSTVYGPATVTNVGGLSQAAGQPAYPTNAYPGNSYPPSGYNGAGYNSAGYNGNAYNGNVATNLPPTLETRSGPSTVQPGGTDRLWDYTVGTPSLPQLQQQPNASVGGGMVTDLREVLRFDIVPGWLPQRFARVTTVTSNVQMDGLRVPLITGTQPKDIAGTLTYYFDASQSLKRINLHGLTGDPTQLANLMVQFYQVKPEQSLGGQLFTARWNNRVTSVMQISPAPIIYAGADHSKYIIFLELNQPSNQYGLSDEASEILRTTQATQRW